MALVLWDKWTLKKISSPGVFAMVDHRLKSSITMLSKHCNTRLQSMVKSTSHRYSAPTDSFYKIKSYVGAQKKRLDGMFLLKHTEHVLIGNYKNKGY